MPFVSVAAMGWGVEPSLVELPTPVQLPTLAQLTLLKWPCPRLAISVSGPHTPFVWVE
jgi:hypothetical protein